MQPDSEKYNKIKTMLRRINSANDNYVEVNEHNVKQFSKNQSPIATIVMCCDSRAHTTSFTYNPENNFFLVRNIGNQYILNQGCVEFGVRVLNTPVLIYLGHTQCGAVNASLEDYSRLPSSIIREIDHLALASRKTELCGEHDERWMHAVINNVNHQVDLSLKDFTDLHQSDNLLIMGMVLDIDNQLKQGYGRISVVNINGETSHDKLKENPLVRDFFTNL